MEQQQPSFENLRNPQQESFGQKVKRKTMNFVRKMVISLILITIVVFLFLYFFTYESGVMAGKVLRLSEKGLIFKTYEGKINLETFGALKGASPIAESYDFSVDSGNKELIADINEVSLSGERVNLHYKKYLVRFFWRGDTKTFATGVERAAH